MSPSVMPSLLVAAAGTDLGKTHVCQLLLRQVAAVPLKPVLSGHGQGPSDIHLLLEAAGLPVNASTLAAHCPWRFAAPLAPPMAAAREGRTLRLKEVLAYCEDMRARTDAPLLLETAGGIMSPLTGDATCLDLAKALGWPVLFIAGSYVGAISHALTGLRVLAQEGLHVALTIINESADSPAPLEETREAVQRFSPFATPVLALPRGPLDLAGQTAKDMLQPLADAGFR